MDRRNLIARLVNRKLQTAGNARPICICMASPQTDRMSTASNGGSRHGAGRPQK